MTKNNLVLLLKYRSHFDYPIRTPLVSFILLCPFVEAGLIFSLGTLTLTDIDHVSIMISIDSPTPKIDGITGQSDPKYSSVHGNWTPHDTYISSIGSKTRRYKDTRTRHAKQSYLMIVTWTSTLPERRHHRSKLVYLCLGWSSITFSSYVMEVCF